MSGMHGRCSSKWLASALIALGLFVAACGGGSSKAVAASGIPQQIVCPCSSCDEVLSACESECTIGARLKQTIGNKLESGQSNEQVLQYFVNMYGEGVLAPGSRFEPQTY
jgi:cytochrome c-type biogenesis protein CcmH/NrfF